MTDQKGVLDIGGVTKEVVLSLVPKAKVGDWVLIHAGFGIQVISEEDALETVELLNELQAE